MASWLVTVVGHSGHCKELVGQLDSRSCVRSVGRSVDRSCGCVFFSDCDR